MEKTLGFVRSFCCFCFTRPEEPKRTHVPVIGAPSAPEMSTRRRTRVHATERFPIAVPGVTSSRGGSVRVGSGRSSHIYTPPKRHQRMSYDLPRTKEGEEPEQEWRRIAKASLNDQSLSSASLPTIVEEKGQEPGPLVSDHRASPPQQTGPHSAGASGNFTEAPTCRSFDPPPGGTTTTAPRVSTRSLTAAFYQDKATEIGIARPPASGAAAGTPLAVLDTNSKLQPDKPLAKSIGSPKGLPFTTPHSSFSDGRSKTSASEPGTLTPVSSAGQSRAMESLLAAFPTGRYGHGYLKRCLTAMGGNAPDVIEALKGNRELPPSLVGADEKEELGVVGGMEVFNAGPGARPMGKAQ